MIDAIGALRGERETQRLFCPALNCTDKIDGEFTVKRRFAIFDYCGNFEFLGRKSVATRLTDPVLERSEG